MRLLKEAVVSGMFDSSVAGYKTQGKEENSQGHTQHSILRMPQVSPTPTLSSYEAS